MELYLSVIGIALSVASLVPAFAVKKIRLRVVGVLLAVALIGTIGAQLWKIIAEGRETDKVRDLITSMFSGNHPMTIEQVFTELNRGAYATTRTAIDYATVAKVVDDLVDRGSLHSRLVELDAGKNRYLVRVFNSVNWPIP